MISHLYQCEVSNFHRGDQRKIAHLRNDRDIYRQVVFDLDFVQVDVDALNLEKCENLRVFESVFNFD